MPVQDHVRVDSKALVHERILPFAHVLFYAAVAKDQFQYFSVL